MVLFLPSSSKIWVSIRLSRVSTRCGSFQTPSYGVQNISTRFIIDARGTWWSEGEAAYYCSPGEGRDGYDIVEWVAKQYWYDVILHSVTTCLTAF